MYIGKVNIGSTDYLIGSTLYGTCDTAAATAAKVVTMSDFDTLLTGVTIHVKFTNSNTVASPTLNVNGTGAKSIKIYGTTGPSTSSRTSWNAGSVISFTYDGTYWQMNDWSSDTTYTGYDILFKNNDGGTLDTYKPLTSPSKAFQAGDNITMTAASNVITIKATDTTYSIGTGDSNGQIKVTPSSGNAYNVSVKGLGSRAYDSTSYLPLAGGTMESTGNITFGYNEDTSSTARFKPGTFPGLIWVGSSDSATLAAECPTGNDLKVYLDLKDDEDEQFNIRWNGTTLYNFTNTQFVSSNGASFEGNLYLKGNANLVTNSTGNYANGIRVNRQNASKWAGITIGYVSSNTSAGESGYDSYTWMIATPAGSNYLNISSNGNTSTSTALTLKGHGNDDIVWNNNKIWHEGNDGSGSGLDADLLDGNHASAFALSGHTHTNYISRSERVYGGNLLRENGLQNTTSTSVSYNYLTKTYTLVTQIGKAGYNGSGVGFKTSDDWKIRIPFGYHFRVSMDVYVPSAHSICYDNNNYPVSGSAWSGNDNDTNRVASMPNPIPANTWTTIYWGGANLSTSNTNKVDIYLADIFGLNTSNDTSTITWYIRNIKVELGQAIGNWSVSSADALYSVGVTDDSTNHANQLMYKTGIGTKIYFTVPYATNANTATKLATARTLWGQSFDGTANITGSLSNTGSITPSSTATSSIGSSNLTYAHGYFEQVHIKNNLITTTAGNSNNYLTTITDGNEIVLGSNASTMYINYRSAPSGKTTINSYKWNAGSSSTWAKHEVGEFTARGTTKIYVSGTTSGVPGIEMRMANSNISGPEIVIDPVCTDGNIGTGADYASIGVDKPTLDTYLNYAPSHKMYVSPRTMSNPGYFNSSGAWVAPSDISLKKDIYKPTKDKLHEIWEWLVQKGFKNFTWKDTDKEDFGVIAQEVLEAVPNAVDYDESKELYGVDYTKLHSHAIAAIVQELKDTKEEIKQLQAQIAELKQLLNN